MKKTYLVFKIENCAEDYIAVFKTGGRNSKTIRCTS